MILIKEKVHERKKNEGSQIVGLSFGDEIK